MASRCIDIRSTLHHLYAVENMILTPLQRVLLIIISNILLLWHNWAVIVQTFGDAIEILRFIGPICIQRKEILACLLPIINNQFDITYVNQSCQGRINLLDYRCKLKDLQNMSNFCQSIKISNKLANYETFEGKVQNIAVY